MDARPQFVTKYIPALLKKQFAVDFYSHAASRQTLLKRVGKIQVVLLFAMCGQVVYYLREVIEMCLAFPAKVLAIEGDLATVERAGVTRKASLMLLPEAKVGDFVLIHAGFAMQTIDEREVQIRDALVAEMNGAPRTVEKLL